MNFEVKIPSERTITKLEERMTKSMESYIFKNSKTNLIYPICCSICDRIPSTEYWWKWMKVEELKILGKKFSLEKIFYRQFVEKYKMLDDYSVGDPFLDQLILSPKTVFNEDSTSLIVCKECGSYFDGKKLTRSSGNLNKWPPPPNAIANGHFIGKTPTELINLTDVEMALISDVRVQCQSWAFFGGAHQQIKGWHTLYGNKVGENIFRANQLSEAGLNGQLLVVLCGPFTSTQKAIALQKVKVRPDKLILAFEWLKKNNIYYKDMIIPQAEDLPTPQILDNSE